MHIFVFLFKQVSRRRLKIRICGDEGLDNNE